MFIERLRVTNFRSFRELDLKLPPLSVLVGANASGKTNFVQLFRFLRDVANEGFESAIALQGGVELVRNLRLGTSEPLTVEVEGKFPSRRLSSKVHHTPTRYRYSLRVEFTRGRAGYRVTEELLGILFELREAEQHEVLLTRRGSRVEMEIPKVFFADGRQQQRDLSLSKMGVSQSLLQMFSWRLLPLEPESVFASLAELGTFLRTIVAYDFDVRAMKRPARLEARPRLEESGENLAVTLRELFRSREQRRTFHRMLQQFLPGVQGVSVQVGAEKSISYSLREQHLGQRRLPSYRLSDGTVELTALIVALYFTPTRLLIIEEPDRHLHPALIGRLMHHLKETIWRRQILVTTHNPEMVRHTPLESLLLVQRDREGFSQITRPSENEYVKHFLQHELGLHELFVDNLLGVRDDPLPTG
jgi:predicted ATPase